MSGVLTMSPLGEFVEQQIRMRNISDREFARLVGVSNSTIARVRSPNPPEPTFDFLVKLSKLTGHSLVSLVKLAFPDAKLEVDERTLMLAERILALPDEERRIAAAHSVSVDCGDDWDLAMETVMDSPHVLNAPGTQVHVHTLNPEMVKAAGSVLVFSFPQYGQYQQWISWVDTVHPNHDPKFGISEFC